MNEQQNQGGMNAGTNVNRGLVDGIKKQLDGVQDKDTLLAVGRNYMEHAKAIGINEDQIKPLLQDAWHPRTGGGTQSTTR